MSKRHPIELQEVIERLRLWRQEVKIELSSADGHAEKLAVKRQIDAAIGCLELCQRHQIRPEMTVKTLPLTQTQTPSSNYRVLEDHETGDRECWTELEVDGAPLHLYPGDFVVSKD